jgi:transposase
MRNVPGKKNDEDDAEWIASLYMCGLLEKSFVPEKGIRSLREFTRFYVKLNQSKNQQSNRIEKFLQTHGFKLSSVLSSVTGTVSGKRILEKLCTHGEVSESDLEESLDRGVKKTAEEIAYAIVGKLTLTLQVLLRMLLDTFYSIEKNLDTLYENMQNASMPYKTFIALIDTIPGIDVLAATYIIAEIGVDMSRFKTVGHLVSWAGLCPRDDISAGKIKSKKILKGNSYVKAILCQCAWAAVRTRNTRLSNWYWRNAKRLGEKKAIIAVARKLLCYIYYILSTGKPYDKELDKADTEKYRAYKLESAKKQVLMLDVGGKTPASDASYDENNKNTNKSDKPKTRSKTKNQREHKQLNSDSSSIAASDCIAASEKTGQPIASPVPEPSDTAALDAAAVPEKTGQLKESPIPESFDTISSDAIIAPKKRGRPRKSPISESSDIASDTIAVPKKRGRPKKSPALGPSDIASLAAAVT